MKIKLILSANLFWIVSLLVLSICFPARTWAGQTTFYTKDSILYDPCGQPLLIRGVNAGIAFPSDPDASKMIEIAKTGANTVRLTFRWLYNKSTPQSVENALKKVARNKMVAMPSIWETTGKWEQLQFAVDYWSQPEMVDVLRQYEDIILLNIANEAGDEKVDNKAFRRGYSKAIRQLRKAGLHMPLVIDAANWGRREADILQNAQYLLSQDPDKNLLFSWHPWDIGQQRERYKTAIETAIKTKIPLIIGEFASTEVDYETPIDYRYIMRYAAEQKIGWLWWWWESGQPIDTHSMTSNGVYGNWVNEGEEIALTSQYGLKNTSVRTHYLLHRECKTPQRPSLKPNAPSHLKVSATKGAEVRLAWVDNSNNEKNFDIEVFNPLADSWRLIKVVATDTTSTTIGADLAFNYSINSSQDKSLGYETSYQFRVGAYQTKQAVSYSKPSTVTTSSNPSICSDGDGLKAEYFFAESGNHNFVVNEKPVVSRVDKEISFKWGKESPSSKIAKNHFQVRWSGFIEPQFNGKYTFYIKNNNNLAQLWIDGKQVINNWGSNAREWLLGEIELEKGKKYSLLMQYRKIEGDANVDLQWASSKLERKVISQCRLFTY